MITYLIIGFVSGLVVSVVIMFLIAITVGSSVNYGDLGALSELEDKYELLQDAIYQSKQFRLGEPLEQKYVDILETARIEAELRFGGPPKKIGIKGLSEKFGHYFKDWEPDDKI